MNIPELNNYIQYVTRKGIVKARSVVFQDNGETTTFDVNGINEDFFIFAVFQNNLQRYGIGFENFDNVNMLSFINSNMVDLACVPENSFLPSEQVVTMSYNNDYVKNFFNGGASSVPPNDSFLPKTNELLYLEAYAKENYTDNAYQIIPFATFASGINLDRRNLYFCKFDNLYPVLIKIEDLNADALVQSDSYYIFTTVHSQNGNQLAIQGYKLRFDNPISVDPNSGGSGL